MESLETETKFFKLESFIEKDRSHTSQNSIHHNIIVYFYLKNWIFTVLFMNFLERCRGNCFSLGVSGSLLNDKNSSIFLVFMINIVIFVFKKYEYLLFKEHLLVVVIIFSVLNCHLYDQDSKKTNKVSS